MVEWKRVEEVEYRERERERERELQRSYICAGTLYSFSPVQYLVDGTKYHGTNKPLEF